MKKKLITISLIISMLILGLFLFGQRINQKNKININTATFQQLDELELIGETKAERIIEHRSRKKEVKSIKELDQIKGIGDKTIQAIEDDVIAD